MQKLSMQNSLGSHLSNILIFITLVKYSTWAIMCSVSATETHELTLHYPTGWRHRDVALAWRAGELHSHRKTVSRDESAFTFKKDISMHTWAYKMRVSVCSVFVTCFFITTTTSRAYPGGVRRALAGSGCLATGAGIPDASAKYKHIAISVLEMWRMDWLEEWTGWEKKWTGMASGRILQKLWTK